MFNSDKKIVVEKFTIDDDRTYVIAEIGSNHNQDLQLAYESIDAAVECGADAVKFQSLNVKKLYYSPSPDMRELHQKIDLQEEWHSLLKSYSDRKGITFFSSPTYLEAVDILESIEVSLYKLASAQIGTFPQLVSKVAATGKPTIFSTGLVSYGELEKVVRIFQEQGNHKFIILHCNSTYPTPPEEVNLSLIETYRKMFGCPVGFSDHTQGITIPIAAVTLGACVIEKHFTISRNLPVPDASFSLEPQEFQAMVKSIRAVEESKKFTPRTEIIPEEKKFKDSILYRVVLNQNKQANERLLPSEVNYLRYHEGVDCRELWHYSTVYLNKNLPAGTLLHAEDIRFQ